MGDSEQKTEKKEAQQKGTVFMPKDSTQEKADSLKFMKSIEQREQAEKEGHGIITEKDKLISKNDSLAADSLVKRAIKIREENNKQGINPITDKDRKPRIIR